MGVQEREYMGDPRPNPESSIDDAEGVVAKNWADAGRTLSLRARRRTRTESGIARLWLYRTCRFTSFTMCSPT